MNLQASQLSSTASAHASGKPHIVSKEPPAIVAEAHKILRETSAALPRSIGGLERQMMIGDVVSRMDEGVRDKLRGLMNHFLGRMLHMSASDIDLGGYGTQGQIWYRIHGVKRPDPSHGVFTPDEMNIQIQALLGDRQRNYLFENRNLDFSHMLYLENGEFRRFRADAYFDLDQLALNMRAINNEIRPFKALELHANVAKVLSLAHTKDGLCLVTGITGSGKSTTLDTIIDANNHSVDAHVVIIAAPVEYVHKSDRCIVRHREVGRDVLSFKEGAVQALRQDPDIIMIGEMRDADTIMTSLEITDSGHKVFSTLHTGSAVESIDRIIAETPPIEQERVRNRLADVIRCVISQKLVPSLDGKRVLAKEVLVATPSVRAAIKNSNTSEVYQMISEGSELGMTTLEMDLRRLYMLKRISLETVMNFANNKRRMQQLLAMQPTEDLEKK